MQSRQAGVSGMEGNPSLDESNDEQVGLWVILSFGDCDRIRSQTDTGNL